MDRRCLRNFIFGGLAASLVLTGGGCGRQRPVKVSGVVLLDNKPLKDATLTFNPVDRDGRAAAALSRNDGTFDVTTYTDGDGALPGDYKITVSVPPPSSSGSQVKENLDMKTEAGYKNFLKIQARTGAEQQRRGGQQKKDPAGPKPVYSELDKTPLKCRVPTEGALTIKLESERGGR